MDFAPTDPTDGRRQFDWKSRYTDSRCRLQMWLEALYLVILLLGIPFALLWVWLGHPQDWLDIDATEYDTFKVYAFAWLSGTLGGTVFDVKWLYHTVAKGYWNVDRCLWRIFTPHLSGAFAFAIIALTTSGLVSFLDSTALKTGPAVVGLGFLFGYFSDYTVARLNAVARRVLGEHETRGDGKA